MLGGMASTLGFHQPAPVAEPAVVVNAAEAVPAAVLDKDELEEESSDEERDADSTDTE
jgi:hypothetical protein